MQQQIYMYPSMCLLLFKKQLAEDDTAELDTQYTHMKN